jgi:hypothetical protein
MKSARLRKLDWGCDFWLRSGCPPSSSVKWIRNTPTPTRQWHDLKVRIAGPKVTAYLDGKLYLEHVLAEPVSGRIGLWSKADSHMYFDDFTVTPAD